VTITTRNGVVYVQGYVSDEWDLYHILDRARKIAGRRKIVNDLEFDMVGDDSD
jgi:osmotically-inducible protein OsmY